MPRLLGEYQCKVDAKGRIRIPSDLIKQLGDERFSFVVNRGFENCLVLYPKTVWDRITRQIDKLNTYRKEVRQFVRFFYRGATELTMDKADRVLLPKRLAEYAGIEKELILFAVQDRVEIWSVKHYDETLGAEPDDFADLAEKVMGDMDSEKDEE